MATALQLEYAHGMSHRFPRVIIDQFPNGDVLVRGVSEDEQTTESAKLAPDGTPRWERIR